ncbi:hypothetical protein IL306_014083 [Fusarium sp. DS 682]|nr:hypothetical protein IL306_014083 [Fusarium sp. DS 682]
MDAFSHKYSDDGAAVITQAYNILRCNDEQLSPADTPADRLIIKSAADGIVFVLGGMEGLTSVEFKILVGYATMIDPTRQLTFLDNLLDIIRASRQVDFYTEYDHQLFNFVESIHTGLARARGHNLGLYIPPPLADDNVRQQVDDQGLAPVDGVLQFPPAGTTHTWRCETEEVGEMGTYTHSVVEGIDASMFGGTYTTTRMTSSSFTPSSMSMTDRLPVLADFGESVGSFAETLARTGAEEGLSMPFEGLQLGRPDDASSFQVQGPPLDLEDPPLQFL